MKPMNASPHLAIVKDDASGPLADVVFDRVLVAAGEAVYKSLLQASTVQSKYGTAEAIPIDRLRGLLTRK